MYHAHGLVPIVSCPWAGYTACRACEGCRCRHGCSLLCSLAGTADIQHLSSTFLPNSFHTPPPTCQAPNSHMPSCAPAVHSICFLLSPTILLHSQAPPTTGHSGPYWWPPAKSLMIPPFIKCMCDAAAACRSSRERRGPRTAAQGAQRGGLFENDIIASPSQRVIWPALLTAASPPAPATGSRQCPHTKQPRRPGPGVGEASPACRALLRQRAQAQPMLQQSRTAAAAPASAPAPAVAP